MADETQDELTTQGALNMHDPVTEQDPLTTHDQLNLIEPSASEQLLLQGVVSYTSPRVEKVARKEASASTTDRQVKPRSTDLFPEILALQNTDLISRTTSSNGENKPKAPINDSHSDAVLRTLREELTLLLNDLNYFTEDTLTEPTLTEPTLTEPTLTEHALSKAPSSEDPLA